MKKLWASSRLQLQGRYSIVDILAISSHHPRHVGHAKINIDKDEEITTNNTTTPLTTTLPQPPPPAAATANPNDDDKTTSVEDTGIPHVTPNVKSCQVYPGLFLSEERDEFGVMFLLARVVVSKRKK